MNTKTDEVDERIDNLSNDAQEFLAATADVAGEKVEQARNRLSEALKVAKDKCAKMQSKAVEGAKITDKAIRKNPYQAIGIAFAVGAVAGYLLRRKD